MARILAVESAPPDGGGEDFFAHAEALAMRALGAALREAKTDARDLTHLFIATTGLAASSLEARLANATPFQPAIKRTPLADGAGASGALARAVAYLRDHPGETVAALSITLGSLSFLPEDGGALRHVPAARPGDGAVCAILCGDKAAAGVRSKFSIVDGSSEPTLLILAD